MATPQQQIQLARSLPRQLMTFFARYPPPLHQSAAQDSPTSTLSAQSSVAAAPLTPPTDLNADVEGTHTTDTEYRSPFRHYRHPITGRWHDPKYSLRRQKELVKLAHQHGVAELLPFTAKSPEEKFRKRVASGLRVKGTGVGQHVKGKAWERTLKGRLEQRVQAMLEMPSTVQKWKERGHGRGWKKWPK